jgi:arsenate reductase
MSRKKRVLFLCTGNSARSQMAEGLVNSFLGDHWEAYSAGSQPAASVHPLAVEVMREWGIDISDHEPKSAHRFQHDPFDAVITLCDDAARTCPLWVGTGAVAHRPFPDPVHVDGDLEQRLGTFRQVRDAIRETVLAYLQQIDNAPDKEISDDS